MTATKIIGPSFFDSNIDSESYGKLLKDFFLPRVFDEGWNKDHFFQQDGAAPHVTRENLELLKGVFGERVFSRKYPDNFDIGIAWPPYSPDLSPLDFFLWGYLKDKIFENAPKTIESLSEAIVEVLESVPAVSCGRTIASFEKRLRYLVTAGGGYIENIPS